MLDEFIEKYLRFLVIPIGLVAVMALGVPRLLLFFSQPTFPEPAGVPVQAGLPSDARYAAAVAIARAAAQALVVDGYLPGLSVAVGVDGELVWAAGFGFADVDAEVPATPATRYRIGAVNMPLTAAAVGRLVERGVLDLDAPVQRYRPHFRAEAHDEPPITTRLAMAHAAGIRHHSGERDIFPGEACPILDDALARFADDDLLYAPGSGTRFSVYGWVLVSAVVESAAGQPFADVLAREVLAPLGMQDTVPDDPADPARARIYWPRASLDPHTGLEFPEHEGQVSCHAGAGGYLSTPSDLVRFGLAMDAGRLLSAETTALLETPVRLASGTVLDHGLGWFVEQEAFAGGRTRLVGHPGVAVGGTTTLRRYPEQGVVVAVSTNVSFATLAPYARQVAEAFAATRDPSRPE